ncbi:FAD-binding oxidoreductase [Salipiger pacificus]|nr:FAD-binding oxidoreductase [Alloyangia pacifica]
MSRDVTVVGAGIVGICCALSLARRGVQVRLIDRGAPGQGTSSGNAGIVSPWSIAPQATPGLWKKLPELLLSPERPLTVRPGTWPRMIGWGTRFLANGTEAKFRAVSEAMRPLCSPSIRLYERHLEEAGVNEPLLQGACYVHAFRSEDGGDLSALDYRVRAEAGARLERIGAGALRELEPDLGPDFRAAVLIHEQARALSPGRLGAVLADAARRRGVEIEQRTVEALTPSEGGWELQLAGESRRAARVVVAAGAWSARLLRPLGLRLPLIAERGYHMQFANPGVRLNHSVMDMDAKLVASSMTGGLRVAGAAEFGPLDTRRDPRRAAQLRRQAKRLCPGLDDTEGALWMGHRPSLPDSLPALGRIGGLPPGLFAAFGHSHYGLMMAPATGEIIADLLTEKKTNTDMTPYDARRFG